MFLIPNFGILYQILNAHPHAAVHIEESYSPQESSISPI